MLFARVLKSFRHASMLGLVAAAALPSSALAVSGQHATLASFQAATRGNTLLEPFNGPDIVPFAAPLLGSGNGFSYFLAPDSGTQSLIRTSALGVGASTDVPATRFTFTGRPVSAFAGTLRVANFSFASVGGTVNIQTDTGENFSVNVAAGGTFFGVTTARPFTALTINTVPDLGVGEMIDDAYIGISATAPELSDQCADAVTVNPTTAAQYPFTTAGIGATATAISGSCATIDSGPDLWLRFVSPVSGNITINTCGATFDTVLRVFDGCGPAGTGVGAMQIACDDDFCTGGGVGLNRASQVQFRAEAGEDYLIRVSGFNGATGSGVLTFSVVPDCAADFNHSGSAPSVQDIFDFLSAYFEGC